MRKTFHPKHKDNYKLRKKKYYKLCYFKGLNTVINGTLCKNFQDCFLEEVRITKYSLPECVCVGRGGGGGNNSSRFGSSFLYLPRAH